MNNSLAVNDDCNLVLVVDDQSTLREFVLEVLTRENIQCVGAGSVQEALALIKGGKIKLTLLDWALRGTTDSSGAEVLSYCKEHHPSMPVIVMSGAPFDVRTDAIAGEADGFVQKPFNGTVIVGQIKQCLKWLKPEPNTGPNTFLPNKPDEILSLEQIKVMYIRHVVQLLNDNVSLAATKLGVHRNTISKALKEEL